LSERVILVDRDDRPVGTAGKLQAHRDGALHRAFSVFVFRPDGALLLQRRAWDKYHSAGLWSNACCSHPRPGEAIGVAARRRLDEEMGVRCDVVSAFSFVYRADVGGGLIEHEYDHVFVGTWSGVPRPDPAEVAEWRWASPEAVGQALLAGPHRFTPWFRIAFRALHVRARV
jgi:isopentenyl-diphosphate delta-isomerase